MCVCVCLCVCVRARERVCALCVHVCSVRSLPVSSKRGSDLLTCSISLAHPKRFTEKQSNSRPPKTIQPEKESQLNRKMKSYAGKEGPSESEMKRFPISSLPSTWCRGVEPPCILHQRVQGSSPECHRATEVLRRRIG